MPDDIPIESDALFSRPARTILGQWRHSWLRHVPRITYAVLVGRAISSDTQTLDPLFDETGRMRTDAAILGTGSAIETLSSMPTTIGQRAWVSSGSVAGNATATIPALASAFGDAIFSVEQILHTLDCDATVASRVPTLTVVAGMPSIISALNDWAQVGATSTQNEDSKMFVPRGPATVKLNDNGTFSDGATSPLPMLVGDGGQLSVAVAAGVVGDAHSLSALVRRIA